MIGGLEPRRHRGRERPRRGLAVPGCAALALGLLTAAPVAGQVTRDLQRLVREGREYLLVRNATVIDGTGGPPREHASVLLRAGFIEAVGAADDIIPPEGGRVLDANEMYLVPGFIDVRAYARDSTVLEALLAAGITHIRNPVSSVVDGVDLAEKSLGGGFFGPRVYSGGPVIDAPPGTWPGAVLAATEEEVREAVRQAREAGASHVSLYVGLPPPLVAAAIDEAHELGLTVIGDLGATSWTEAARAGIDFLSNIVSPNPNLLSPESRELFRQDVAAGRAHPYYRWLELLDLKGPEVDEMVGALLSRDVLVDPNLALVESVLFCGDSAYEAEVARFRTIGAEEAESFAPTLPDGKGAPVEGAERGEGGADADVARPGERVPCPADAWPADFRERARAAWPKALAFVRLLYEQGVRLVAGSGAPYGRFPPGSSFHRELELLAQAGIPKRHVIRIGTANGAVALGILHQTGTIEAGKRADMVLLRGNPLRDIRNTRRIEWVLTRSKFFVPTAAFPTEAR